jgi:hypothetical protein
MAKVKQVVKSFVEMMAEVNELSWEAFLAKEEDRLGRRFFPMGKTLGEESRLIAYLNFICKNSNYRPKFTDAFRFFETWKRVSGYMPFEGRAGSNPGVKADIVRVNQGIKYFTQCFAVGLEPSMTQEDWDADFAFHHQKVFGAYAGTEPIGDDIPF